jgi:hypothetical protein
VDGVVISWYTTSAEPRPASAAPDTITATAGLAAAAADAAGNPVSGATGCELLSVLDAEVEPCAADGEGDDG